MFGVQMLALYGTAGEFSVGSGADAVRVKYILTKIRPGSDGTWESTLAGNMRPWREIFPVGKVTFDELLQRDLDDSRVAHDLIPYLLGTKGDSARFFPPILAVLAPGVEGAGIEDAYPAPQGDEQSENFPDLFKTSILKIGNQDSPISELKYNPSKTRFIIVDGQHRAMAILALHRQLDPSNWGNNPYASYYKHILVTQDQVKKIELPVCVAYFPEINSGNATLIDSGVSLKTVCRELFLTVNKTAKKVSRSRELLLDDVDLAARQMRRTLSKFKSRPSTIDSALKITAVSYGDADSDAEKEGALGGVYVTSAVLLHKLHAVLSFGPESGFGLTSQEDITDGRRLKNVARPTDILLGTPYEHLPSLSRQSGRSFSPDEVRGLVEKLGELNDIAILGMLDELAPLQHHNAELADLERRLSDVNAASDLVQQKCKSLIFEGSGVSAIFDDHLERLRQLRQASLEKGATVEQHVEKQIEYCESVIAARNKHTRDLYRRRACRLANIDYDKLNSKATDDDWRELENWSREIYTALTSQAFQLGFCMSVFSLVESAKGLGGLSGYSRREEALSMFTKLTIKAINAFLSEPKLVGAHHTLTGFIREPRSRIFSPQGPGLRGLLSMSTTELNERKWGFFKYAIWEILFSPVGFASVRDFLTTVPKDKVAAISHALQAAFRAKEEMKEALIQKAEESALRDKGYLLRRMQLEASLSGGGSDVVQEKLEAMDQAERRAVRQLAETHLKASGCQNTGVILALQSLLAAS